MDIQTLVTLSQDQNLNCNRGERVMIIDPQLDLDWLTDEEVGECFYEDYDEDVLRDVLTQAVDKKNSVLHDDNSPYLYEDKGLERDLNKLIDIQERMATGMAIIKDMTSRRDKSLRTYTTEKCRFNSWMRILNKGEAKWESLPGKAKEAKLRIYKSWKSKLWSKARPHMDARNDAWEAYEAHKEYLATPEMAKYMNRLWDRWNDLREQAAILVETASSGRGKMWYEYFSLVEDEDYLSFVGFDPEDIDSSIELGYEERKAGASHTDHIDCVAAAHVSDPFSQAYYLVEPELVDIPVRTWGYVPKVRDVTSEYELAKGWEEVDRFFWAEVDNMEVPVFV